MITLLRNAFAVIFTGILAINTGWSQDFDELVEKCFSYIDTDDTAKFSRLYPCLYYTYCKQLEPTLKAATCAVNKGLHDKALAELYSFISEDFLIDKVAKDTDFTPLHNHSGWKKFLLKADSIEAAHNLPLKKELLTMQDEDQSIRLLVIEAEKKYGVQSEMVNKLRKRMKAIDRKNVERFEEIIEEYGWPGKDALGEDGDLSMFLIIQHIDDEIVQQKYLPLLKKAADNKKTEPWHFAFLTDRILMNQGKQQIYGTQVIRGTNADCSYIVPLKDADKVDEWRAEVGLEPLSEYLQEFGLSWDKEKYKENSKQIKEMFRKYYEAKKMEIK